MSHCVLIIVTLILFQQSSTADEVSSVDSRRPSKRVLECYQCNSANVGEDKCTSSDRNVLEVFRKKCRLLTSGFFFKDAHAIGCRKTIQEIQRKIYSLENILFQSNITGGESMSRECAYSGAIWDGKIHSGTKAVRNVHYQCDTELCNSAIQSTNYHIFIIFLSPIILILTQF